MDRIKKTVTFTLKNPLEASLYTKLKWKVSTNFIFEPGIRYNYYSVYSSKFSVGLVFPCYRF